MQTVFPENKRNAVPAGENIRIGEGSSVALEVVGISGDRSKNQEPVESLALSSAQSLVGDGFGSL
jgi:hypothetical protein